MHTLTCNLSCGGVWTDPFDPCGFRRTHSKSGNANEWQCQRVCRRKRYCCLPVELTYPNVLGALLAGELSTDDIVREIRLMCGARKAVELVEALPRLGQLKDAVAKVSA